MDEDRRERSEPREQAEDEIDRRLADFLELREAGVDFEDWLRDQGEAAAELRERYARYRRIEGVLDRALPPLEVFSAFFHRRRRPGSPGSSGEELPLEVKAGDELGEFSLVARLGRGGMGEVWEAEQQGVGRRVALKLMVPRDDGGRRASRFDLEPIALGRVSHPGIVAVFATGESDGVRWIAQELVQGGSTLDDFIRESRAEERPRDFDQRVAELFVTLADALQHVHEVGVLHRDVKPRNILVTPQGEPKLADFGLARVSDDQSLSESRHLLGTVPYMSPEQVAGEELDPRSDVFSLGVVLYEVLTGERPFHGDSQGQLMLRIANAEPLDARAHRRDLDPDLAAICAKAIEKRPQERYQSAGELADDLVRFVRGEATHARPAGPLRRARKWARRNRALVGSAAAVVLVAAPLVAWGLDARAAAREAEKQTLMESALTYFAIGLIDEGQEEVERLIRLDPEDPRAYLTLAGGLAGAGHNTEADLVLERCPGWTEAPEESELHTPTEHLAYAVQVLVDLDRERYPSAISHLEQAAADPKLTPATWYPRYQLERALGDLEGAIEALDDYLEGVPLDRISRRVLVAERYELEGEHERALAELDAVARDPEHQKGQLEPLRIDRRRGRILLTLGRFEEAAQVLGAFLEGHPRDVPSLVNLARARHELSQDEARTQEERQRLLASAEQLAGRAVELDPFEPTAWILRGGIAHERLATSAQPVEPGATPAWARVEESIERLRELGTAGATADSLDSNLCSMRSDWHATENEPEEAERAWSRFVELMPGSAIAQFKLGMMRIELDQQEEALEPLRRARALWDSAGAPEVVAQGADFTRELELFTFCAASRARGEEEEASASLARLMALVEDGALDEPGYLLLLALHLATTTHPELRDCETARGLLETISDLDRLREELEMERMLARIEAACP